MGKMKSMMPEMFLVTVTLRSSAFHVTLLSVQVRGPMVESLENWRYAASLHNGNLHVHGLNKYDTETLNKITSLISVFLQSVFIQLDTTDIEHVKTKSFKEWHTAA